MTTFTRRPLECRPVPGRPGSGPHDWEFMIDGRPAGRCYQTERPGMIWVWHWTLYETPEAGDAGTIEDAQERFKTAFGRHREYLTGLWASRARAV